MYCPKCKCEYREGIITCPDCNEKLVVQLTEDCNEKFEAINPIKVESVANEIEAELIMNLFRDNNIQCFKKSKGTGGYMNIYMGYSVFGEDIYVDVKDYQTAKDLLNDLSANENTMEEDDSNVYYHIPFYRKPPIIARIILLASVVTMIMALILNNLN